MRALFTSALLAVGAFSANNKSHGPWEINTGSAFGPEGTIGINTDWTKTGGQDDIAEIKYTIVLTRGQRMKDFTTTQKLSMWWPTAAVDYAEFDVLYMSTGVWNYKYGELTLAPNANQHDVVAAAPDPTDTYNFVWNSDDPKKIVTQSGLPPITSSRWNPDVGHSTDTADVLNLTFYRSLNV